ncbi:MAG: hypothetical protein U0Y68_22240 [Blastocatellia bacterium]
MGNSAKRTQRHESDAQARDVGTITLKSGRISFLPPVLGRIPIGVFVGDGEFTLEPVLFVERDYISTVTDKETLPNRSRCEWCWCSAIAPTTKLKSRTGGGRGGYSIAGRAERPRPSAP